MIRAREKGGMRTARRSLYCAIIALALVLMTLGGSACRESAKGELMIAVTTDMTPGEDFDALQIEVLYGTAPKQTRIFRSIGPETLRFPFTFAIIQGTEGSKVQVRVITGISTSNETEIGTPLTVHEVSADVPTDRIALLRMHIDFLCAGTVRVRPGVVDGICPADYSCAARLCTRANREQRELPDFDERAVFGGKTAAEGNGTCFDTVRCFSQGRMVPESEIDKEVCTIPRPASGENVSVALVTNAGRGQPKGICGAVACYVPLDADVPHGVELRRDRIRLPAEVCKRLKSPPTDRTPLIGIAVTETCGKKTVDQPTCGTFSSAQGIAATFNAGPPFGYPSDSGGGDADAGATDATLD
jgi:hypothetical protein